MQKDRMHWIDFTRGVCILLVIFVHTSSVLVYSSIDYPDSYKTFNLLFDPYRMPLLMFLSGLLLHRSLSKDINVNLKSKFNLIFWPFLIWSIVVYAAEERLTFINILKTPISAPSLLWYLWFLTAYYIISTITERLRFKTEPIIILSLLISLFITDHLRIDRFFYLFSFFMLGHLFARKKIYEKISTSQFIIGIIFFSLGAYISISIKIIKYDALYFFAPMGLILCILYLSKFYLQSPLANIFEWVGKNSIVFYVCHFPVLIVIAKSSLFIRDLPPELSYIILFIISIIFCILMDFLRKKFILFSAMFDFKEVEKIARGAIGIVTPKK